MVQQTKSLSQTKRRQALAELVQKGRLNQHDEQLLVGLAAVKVMNLDQIWRGYWPESANIGTAEQRLYKLMKYGLITRLQFSEEQLDRLKQGLNDFGLSCTSIYTLSDLGREWLIWQAADPGQQLKPKQLLHDLLLAEMMARLRTAVYQRGEVWSVTWNGERLASLIGETPIVVPDALGIITKTVDNIHQQLPLFFEIDASREAHVRPSSRIGRKIIGNNQFARNWRKHPVVGRLAYFPAILFVIQGGEQRLQNIAASILMHRDKKVSYALALREDLMRGSDFLTTPAWLLIKRGSDELIGEKPNQRQPLFQAEWLAALQGQKALSTGEKLILAGFLSNQAVGPEPLIEASSLSQSFEVEPKSPVAITPSPARPTFLRRKMRVKDRLSGWAARHQFEMAWLDDMSEVAGAFQARQVEPPAAHFTVKTLGWRKFYLELEPNLDRWPDKLAVYEALADPETVQLIVEVIVLAADQSHLKSIFTVLQQHKLTGRLHFYLVTVAEFLDSQELLADEIYHFVSPWRPILSLEQSRRRGVLRIPPSDLSLEVSLIG